MKRIPFLILLCIALPALAQEKPRDEVDSKKFPRVFGTHFGRYGKAPPRVIAFNNSLVRFVFPAGPKDKGLEQHGLYSYFKLVGDFEFEVEYNLTAVNRPDQGYGSSVAIAVDTDAAEGEVYLSRGFPGDPKGAPCYMVTRSIPDKATNTPKYESKMFPSESKRGKLAIHRKGSELICLAADRPGDALKELQRFPFTFDKIRQVRLYGDRGGDIAAFDAWLGSLSITADEITGGIPRDEVPGESWLWTAVCIAVLLGAVALLVLKWVKARRRNADE